jgi:ABC-2 type transport system ATP-binding protein
MIWKRRYLQMFDLPPKRKIPDLSKGMRSKLMLLLAISRGAELLILDEPTDGLDPAATEDVLRELVDISASEGTTMFFSSHQLSEVELIADHIGFVEALRQQLGLKPVRTKALVRVLVIDHVEKPSQN